MMRVLLLVLAFGLLGLSDGVEAQVTVEARVTNPGFLQDIMDGVRTRTRFNLRVDVTEGGVSATAAFFRYKFGRANATKCRLGADYTPRQDIGTPLRVDLAGLPDGMIRLCVFGITANGRQLLVDATEYRWRKNTRSNRIIIVEPTSPSNEIRPYVRWRDAALATNYDLTITDDPGCQNVVQEFLGLTRSWQRLRRLADGTYYVCIAASLSNGTMRVAHNNGFMFEQAAAPVVLPGPFTISEPSGQIEDMEPFARWTPSADATGYELLVTLDMGCSAIVEEHTVGIVGEQQLGPLAQGRYYLCVTAVNATGSTDASNNGQMFTIDIVVPSPGPFDILEPNSAVQTNTPTVSWGDSLNAASYDLVVATDPICTSPVQTHTGLGMTSLILDPIVEGLYYVCVTARNASDATDAANNGFSFLYDVTPPGNFAITAPSSQVFSDSVVVEWEAASDAVSYDVILASDAACTVVDQSTMGVSETQVSFMNLQEQAYYLCVSASDAVGNARDADNTGFMFDVVLNAAGTIVFVGSELVVPDGQALFPPFPPFFGSLEAADWLCTSMAFSAGLVSSWDGLSIEFKAILSDSMMSAASRLVSSGPLMGTDGSMIASSMADLFDGQLTNSIQFDENGVDLAGSAEQGVWTGSTISGMHASSCSDWGNINGLATIGMLGATNNTWVSNGARSCGSQGRLYCIDQQD